MEETKSLSERETDMAIVLADCSLDYLHKRCIAASSLGRVMVRYKEAGWVQIKNPLTDSSPEEMPSVLEMEILKESEALGDGQRVFLQRHIFLTSPESGLAVFYREFEANEAELKKTHERRMAFQSEVVGVSHAKPSDLN